MNSLETVKIGNPDISLSNISGQIRRKEKSKNSYVHFLKIVTVPLTLIFLLVMNPCTTKRCEPTWRNISWRWCRGHHLLYYQVFSSCRLSQQRQSLSKNPWLKQNNNFPSLALEPAESRSCSMWAPRWTPSPSPPTAFVSCQQPPPWWPARQKGKRDSWTWTTLMD